MMKTGFAPFTFVMLFALQKSYNKWQNYKYITEKIIIGSCVY